MPEARPITREPSPCRPSVPTSTTALPRPTTYGRIGVKVWIYKGEVLSQTLRTTPRTMDLSKPAGERRRRDDRRQGDRRPGGFNRDRGQGGERRQGYGSRPAGQGGYNRGPRPAAPVKEGGNN